MDIDDIRPKCPQCKTNTAVTYDPGVWEDYFLRQRFWCHKCNTKFFREEVGSGGTEEEQNGTKSLS